MSKTNVNNKNELKTKAVLWIGEQSEPVSRADLLETVWSDCSPHQASDMLKALVKSGALIKTGERKWARYSVPESGNTPTEVVEEAEAPTMVDEEADPWQNLIAGRQRAGQNFVNILNVTNALLNGEAALKALNVIQQQVIEGLRNLDLLKEEEASE